jgi:iron complex transport system ATP-binding protein
VHNVDSGIPAIQLDGISFRYGDVAVLHDVDVEVRQGDFLCIVGPNGAGKTTLLRVMTHFFPPSIGRALLFGRSARQLPSRERARLVALVAQSEDMVFPNSVRAMVLLGRYPHLSGFGFEGPADYEAADRAIAFTGLTHLASRPVTKLSGGEQHRVTIARALAQETPVLLLDEPNAHLDLKHQTELFDLLLALNRDQGRTIVCVTHDLNLAAQYATRVGILSGGRIAAIGAPEDVLTRELIAAHFGVAAEVRRSDETGRVSIVSLRP